MFSTNLTTHFGKIFANLLRQYMLHDGIISRDTLHIGASCVKCCADKDNKCGLSTMPSTSPNNNYNLKNSNDVASTSCATNNFSIATTNNCNCCSNCIDIKQNGNNFHRNDNSNVQSSLFDELQKDNNNELQQQLCAASGKLETALPSSSFKLAQVWTQRSQPQKTEQKILNQQFEPERILCNLNRKMQAQDQPYLNATNTNLLPMCSTRKHTAQAMTATAPTKSFLRALNTLVVRPIATAPKQLDGPTFKVARRWYSPKIRNRDNCAEWCGEDTCNLNRVQTNLRKSMWVTSDCYKRCPKPFRYDVVFMPGSNKETREYQQTWIECPPIRIVKKPVCCYEPLCLPPICRRPRKPRSELPTDKHNTCGINSCKKEQDPRCIKVREPCCRQKARDKPCCIVYPTPACCQKRCTPYPSFSECCKPEPNRKAPIECLCLVKPTMCEVWADWRKKNLPGQYQDL